MPINYKLTTIVAAMVNTQNTQQFKTKTFLIMRLYIKYKPTHLIQLLAVCEYFKLKKKKNNVIILLNRNKFVMSL